MDVATPVTYTVLLMAVEFAGLHALDLNDDSIRFDNFKRAFADPAPREDEDSDLINYVLHPLMGSETYLRAREGDFGIAGSIAFSLAASLTWEYAIESWTEHPSSKDLFLTTGTGWLIGELRHQLKQYAIRNESSYFWVDPIWWTLEYLEISFTKSGAHLTPVVGWRFPL